MQMANPDKFLPMVIPQKKPEPMGFVEWCEEHFNLDSLEMTEEQIKFVDGIMERLGLQ